MISWAFGVNAMHGYAIMSVRTGVVVLVLSGTLLAGCSTAPRRFYPVLVSPSSDGTAAIVATCREMVDAGVTSNFVRDGLAPTATGVVAAYGTGAVAFAGAGSTLAGTAGAASVALVAMPVVGIAAGILYTRHVRSRRERESMSAMTQCLGEHHLEVAGWQLRQPD